MSRTFFLQMINQHCSRSIVFVSILCVGSIAGTIISSCGTKNTDGSTKQHNSSQQENSSRQENSSKQDVPSETAETVEVTQDQVAMAGITLGKIETRTLSSIVKVNGMLDSPPQNVVSVSPRMGGYVRSTMLLQGLRIRKGQTLAVIEHQDVIMLQQDFLETRSRLEFTEAEYKRQSTLQEENITALKTFQQITAEYKSLQARFAALRQRLSLIGINADKLREQDISASYNLISPIDGYVTELNITLGKFVAPQDIVCRVVNTAHVHAELSVFERDAPKLREGQRVRLTLANELQERTAHIYLIGREISQERTVRVHAHLDKEDTHLLPNTAFKAVIEIGEHPVAALPEDAIVSAEGKDYIFIAASEQQGTTKKAFQRVEVKRGTNAGGWSEIQFAAGVDIAQAQIVVKGAYALLSTMQIGE